MQVALPFDITQCGYLTSFTFQWIQKQKIMCYSVEDGGAVIDFVVISLMKIAIPSQKCFRYRGLYINVCFTKSS